MQPIGANLDKLKLDLLRQLPEVEALGSAWELVCGSSVAAKTQVVGFEAGVLTIRVPSREWRSELEAFRARYLERLGQICPVKVHDLRFTTE